MSYVHRNFVFVIIYNKYFVYNILCGVMQYAETETSLFSKSGTAAPPFGRYLLNLNRDQFMSELLKIKFHLLYSLVLELHLPENFRLTFALRKACLMLLKLQYGIH